MTGNWEIKIWRRVLEVMMVVLLWSGGWYADLHLVESNDTLLVFEGQLQEDEKAVLSEVIYSFRDYRYFDQNQMTEGRAWDLSEKEFDSSYILENCINAVDIGDKSWILILKFNQKNFENDLATISQNFPTISSVIMSYDTSPTITSSPSDDNNIQIISFEDNESLNPFVTKALPNTQNYFFRHKHAFINNWSVMDPTFKFYIITISIWGFIMIVHVLWTWILKRDYSKHLQKILLFIPVFFAVYNLFDYIYFLGWPWVKTNGLQYLQIVQIALVTIFNTLFVGLCCFISKGWFIVRNRFNREELSSITMIVGIFYLVYSAYFIASDIQNLRIAIIVILIVMYLWVALACLNNCIVNIRTLKSHIEMTGRDEVILESLKLKRYLMINFWIVTTAFYLNKIIITSLKTFINENKTVRNIIIANLFIELVIITYFMIIFRTRKWPDYFGLDVFYQRLDSDNREEAPPKSMILHAKASPSWIDDHSAQDCMINNEEASHPGKEKYKEPQVAIWIDTSDVDNSRSYRILRNEEIS